MVKLVNTVKPTRVRACIVYVLVSLWTGVARISGEMASQPARVFKASSGRYSQFSLNFVL